MAKFITRKNCFWEGAYYKAGSVIDTAAQKTPAYFAKYAGKPVKIDAPEIPVPPAAHEVGAQATKPTERESLEEQAKELGISFDKEISDEELAEIIKDFKTE